MSNTKLPALSRGQIIDEISPLSNNSADHDIEFAYRILDRAAVFASKASTPEEATCERCGIEQSKHNDPMHWCDNQSFTFGPADRERQAGEAVATVIKKGADRAWMSERLGSLPDGTYSLYLAYLPAPQAVQAGWIDVDWLSNVIRRVDGRNALGAGALAEKIVEAVAAEELAAVPSPDGKAEQAEAPSDAGGWQTRDQLERALSECIEAFPIPEPGSPLERPWMEAMGDPLSVPGYMKAIATQPTASNAGDLALRCLRSADGWQIRGKHDTAALLRECAAALASKPTASNAGEREASKLVRRWMEMIEYAYQCRDDIRSASGDTPRSNELRLLADEMRAALASKPPAGEPLSDSYIQTVPDKCDRIVWRGRYYHLPKEPRGDVTAQPEQTNGFGPKLTPQVSGFTQPPAGEQKPVGFMSAKQLPLIADPGAEGGVYIPIRKTPAGLLTLALYTAPLPEQVAQEKGGQS